MRRDILVELAEQQGPGSPLAAWVEAQQAEDFSGLPQLRVYRCADGKPNAFAVPGGHAVRAAEDRQLMEVAVYNTVRSTLADKGLLPLSTVVSFKPPLGSGTDRANLLEQAADLGAIFWTNHDLSQCAFNLTSFALAVCAAPGLGSLATTATMYFACRNMPAVWPFL